MMNQNVCKTMIAAIMAAICIVGCGVDEAAGDVATEDCETCSAVATDLPVSFTNLAAEAVLTQSANEETHVQTNTLDLGSEMTVGYFRILWPDLDVQQYTIEGSTDGETYTVLYTNDRGAYYTEDYVALEEAVQARYIRMSGIAASALPVPEVYAADPWTAVEDGLSIYLVQDSNAHTLLALTGVPDGIDAAFGGCNYEAVITAIGEDTAGTITHDTGEPVIGAMAVVLDTIEDKMVDVGFTLTAETATGTWTHDTGDYEVYVPAQDRQGTSADLVEDTSEALGFNSRPAVIPTLQEWQGGKGSVTIDVTNAEWIQSGVLQDSADGQVSYELVDDTGLGDEGYRVDIGCATARDEDSIRVYANTETGLYWGNVTLRQMLVLAANAVGSGVDDSDINISADTGCLALPRGRIRDYPIGAVRGIMLDVGRNTMSLAQIEQIARNLSWFKMNELTLHLQDNALLTYSDKTDSASNARTAYSAYRMESDITGDDGESITAEDLSYTAEEFAALVETCAEFGVLIIPEIDTPAHSLALTSAFPDLGLSGRPDAVDMLDCSNPDALALVERVWDEQLSGAFRDVATIQIGGDEYYGQANDFVQYEAGLISHLAASGKTIRMWGSLTALLGDTRISPLLSDAQSTSADTDNDGDIADVVSTESVNHNIEGDSTASEVPSEDSGIMRQDAAEDVGQQAERIQMQLWSTYWADPMTMYRAGFDLINSSSDRLYINCGEATDYLDKESIYNTYHRTEYAMSDGRAETLPSWSPRLIGSSAALWNDLIDNLEIGISEYDMTDRVMDAMPVLAEVFWQEDGPRTYAEFEEAATVLRTAPDADPLHQRDDLLLGPDYEVSFEVYLPSESLAGEDDSSYVIFGVDVDGNTYEFTARNADGRVGFSREFYDYAFDYTLPTDTWVQIKVVGKKDITSLYVSGELVDTLGSSAAYEEHATFLFPTQVNETFVGQVRNVTVQ